MIKSTSFIRRKRRTTRNIFYILILLCSALILQRQSEIEVLSHPIARIREHPTVLKSTPTSKLQNKTLVMLIGDLRCGERAWESLYRNLLDFNNADVALLTQKPRPDHQNSSLFARSIHVELLPEYRDWSDAMDLVYGSDSWRANVSRYYTAESHPSLLGGVPGYLASGAIVNTYKWFALSAMKRNGWLNHYDRFIVSRTDQFYSCPLDLNGLDPKYVWVPEGEDYGGITDRYIIVSRDKAEATIDTMSPFLQDPASFQKAFAPQKGKWWPLKWDKVNCEKYLLYVWQAMGVAKYVRRFPRCMYTCAIPSDTSRWGSVEGYNEKDGVFMKYRKEFPFVQSTCTNMIR